MVFLPCSWISLLLAALSLSGKRSKCLLTRLVPHISGFLPRRSVLRTLHPFPLPFLIHHKSPLHSLLDIYWYKRVLFLHSICSYRSHMVHIPVLLHLTRMSLFHIYNNFLCTFPIQIPGLLDLLRHRRWCFPSSPYGLHLICLHLQGSRFLPFLHNFRFFGLWSARLILPALFPCSLTLLPWLLDLASLLAQI